jgi:hypothetical protein
MYPMRLACVIAATALASTGCGLDFDRFAVVADGSASDATGSADAGHDGPAGGDSGGIDGATCTGGMATCGSTCVSDCSTCNGGKDYVTCMVCANDGGSPALMCSPADPNGFCLNGNYPHCSCQQDTDCPPGNQRCSTNMCTACGEPLFNQAHTRCNSGGNCCKTGTSLGQCSC